MCEFAHFEMENKNVALTYDCDVHKYQNKKKIFVNFCIKKMSSNLNFKNFISGFLKQNKFLFLFFKKFISIVLHLI